MTSTDIISRQPYWPTVALQQENALSYQMLDKGYKVYTRCNAVTALGGSSTQVWWLLLNPITKGYDKFNRIGNRIRMKQLIGAGNPLGIFYDRMTNGTQPNCFVLTSAGDVSLLFDVDSVSGTFTTLNTYPWNSDMFSRFIFLGFGGGALDSELPCIDLHDLPVIYNENNNGDVGDINSGALWAVFKQAASAPTATWRLVFEDDYE